MTDIERPLAELRATLMLAKARILKLNRDLNLVRHNGHGKGGGVKADPLLAVIHQMLLESRRLTKRGGLTMRVKL